MKLSDVDKAVSMYLVSVTLALALLPGLASAADDIRKTTFKALVADPSAARRNQSLRVYLLGVGDVIWMEYVCSEEDKQTLTNPDAIIDTLVEFSRGTWGKFYLEGQSGIGGIRYEMTAGNAMLKVFTEHSRCQPYDQKRRQLER